RTASSSGSSPRAPRRRPATAACPRPPASCPPCARSAAPARRTRPKWPPTRAPAARCCGWPRGCRRHGRRAHDPLGPGRARAGQRDLRDRRGVRAPPAPRAVRAAHPPGARARRAGHRVRPAAARAGHLGGEQPHRPGRALAPGHEVPGYRRDRGGAAMRFVRASSGTAKKPRPRAQFNLRGRLMLVAGAMGLCAVALVVRAVDLQLVDNDFSQRKADARFLREVPIPTSRGMITDRNGEPLAVSSPVESLWANPQELANDPDAIARLAEATSLPVDYLTRYVSQRKDKEFMYVPGHRRINPAVAQKILALKIPGVFSQREFRRFYPQGEAVAHVLGFTNIDDQGQEGVELAFDEWLRGKPGLQKVIRDRH